MQYWKTGGGRLLTDTFHRTLEKSKTSPLKREGKSRAKMLHKLKGYCQQVNAAPCSVQTVLPKKKKKKSSTRSKQKGRVVPLTQQKSSYQSNLWINYISWGAKNVICRERRENYALEIALSHGRSATQLINTQHLGRIISARTYHISTKYIL